MMLPGLPPLLADTSGSVLCVRRPARCSWHDESMNERPVRAPGASATNLLGSVLTWLNSASLPMLDWGFSVGLYSFSQVRIQHDTRQPGCTQRARRERVRLVRYKSKLAAQPPKDGGTGRRAGEEGSPLRESQAAPASFDCNFNLMWLEKSYLSNPMWLTTCRFCK